MGIRSFSLSTFLILGRLAKKLRKQAFIRNKNCDSSPIRTTQSFVHRVIYVSDLHYPSHHLDISILYTSESVREEGAERESAVNTLDTEDSEEEEGLRSVVAVEEKPGL